MKNKRNIYFLVPAVLIIWGLIGVRVYKAVNPPPIEVAATNPISGFKPKTIATVESYEINADYRDPFLGTMASKKKIHKKTTSTNAKPKEQIVFPTIVYKGIVSPKTNKKAAVYLVQINEQQNLLKLQNTAQEVTLISGNEKEITVEYQKGRKTVSIQ